MRSSITQPHNRMNDPELDEPIREHLNEATQNIKRDLDATSSTTSLATKKTAIEQRERKKSSDSLKQHLSDTNQTDDDAFFQSTLWWFTSTAFPLFAGTFGPIANLFSVCALAQTWRRRASDGGRVPDPAWIITLNTTSLALALAANIVLLLNFARRIRYRIAQPITIFLWYASCILLIPPLIFTHTKYRSPDFTHVAKDTLILSQSFYYGLIACALYFAISTLLLFNLTGAHYFHAYPASFAALTVPQRTLMLQTIVFSGYLALGGGVFASLEGWSFVDGLYWAEYTLLTIGLGSDFPLYSTGARMLLIPFAAFGIVLVGIIVGSVRGLVLERAKVKVGRRKLGKEMEKLKGKRDKLARRGAGPVEGGSMVALEHRWKKTEFKVMRQIEEKAEQAERYTGLAAAALAYVVVWIAGSLVFWATERGDKWTYPAALYFTYTAITTIGYGDLYPTTPAGRPFFVFWTLLAVPVVTILVSHMGNTVVRGVSKVVEKLGRWTVLPEQKLHDIGVRRDEDGKHEKEREHRQQDDLSANVENLGNAISHVEEQHGRGGSLPARLAREIRNVARDVRHPKRYEWEEWVKWLELLGEGVAEGGHDHDQRVKQMGTSWSWLDGDGPLFSTEGETHWVLGRLCKRLEEVLEAEVSSVAGYPRGE